MGRPGWDHRGLPCEPGRCLCQDIALLAQLPVLTPQTGQLLALGAGRALLSAAFIAIGLSHPVPDRLGGRFELARQLLRCSPRSDQINHLSPEFRRIGSVTLRHRWHLLLKWKGVHQTESTPMPTRVSIEETVLAYWRAEGCCAAIAVFGSRTRNITLIRPASVRRASVSKVEA